MLHEYGFDQVQLIGLFLIFNLLVNKQHPLANI